MKKYLVCALAVSALLFSGCTGTQERGLKNIKSNWTGGLNRTITVYDYNGKPIKTWEGKIDISDAKDETDFIVDGKRIIIHGGITIIEEK